MLLAGPVSGAVLGAAALYASTREDFSGAVARKAGSLYLKAGVLFFLGGVSYIPQWIDRTYLM